MKSRTVLPLPLMLMIGTYPAFAREVDLLQFLTSTPNEVASTTNPETTEGANAVAASLQGHFQINTQGHGETGTEPNSGFDQTLPSQPDQVLGSDLSDPLVDAACDAATFSPTWWLPPAAETRRAAWFDTVAQIACEHGLPTRLLDAVISQESGYNARAISPAGAMGMMQIMPGTARSLGLARPFDPIANMRAGARYLRQQLHRFGRVDLALAAYNAGPERRSLRRGAIPRIPETINYVRTITTNWARLAELGQGQFGSADRARAAMIAVNSSPYRSVELVSYD